MVRTPLVPAALVGMLAICGLALSSIYSGDLTARLLVGAGAGAVAISLAVKRLPAWTAAPVSVLALAGYTLLAVRLSAISGAVEGSLRDLTLDALRNGIPRLLTAMIPIEPQPDTVIVPVLATWLAGLGAAEIALRGRRVLLSYAPVTALYGGVLYVVGPNAQPAHWQSLAFAGCAAIGLAASAGRSSDGAPLSRGQHTVLRLRIAAGAAAGLAVVSALTFVLGPTVALRVQASPIDPRRYVTPPQLDALDENPLVRLSGWALNPDQHLFDVDLTGDLAAETRVRLAVLSDYDGVTWRVGATYRSAGRVLAGPTDPDGHQPDGRQADSDARQIDQRITLAELDGRLLPAVAMPRRVDGVRIAYDPASGTLALPEGLQPGLTYSVASRQPRVNVNLLPAADVPAGPSVARYLTMGTATPPPEMVRLATQLSEGQAGPYQRASVIEDFIGEHYQLVGDAPSGHAYPNLSFFLFGPRNAGGQRGTSEQFAAAFAVLGRLLSLPTRVVVGFRVRPGTSAVRGADAFAWPEVLFNGIGWVPFDPLPQPNTQPRPVEDDFRPKPNPSNPPPSAAPTPSLSNAPAPPPRAAAPPAAGVRRIPAVTVLAAIGAGLAATVIGYLLVVPLLRRMQRRRRLRSGDPPARVAGAWLEVHDALRLAHQPAPEHLTASEVAGHAVVAAGRYAHAHRRGALRLPPPSLVDLAGTVNLATFGASGIGEAEAGRATAQATAYVAELRARRPWWRRLLWSLDPRPLRWARRRQSPSRTGGRRQD
jgi:TgpA N-terminal domain/Transglutaminase-like superfamily